jgi:hypothetical protein
MKRAIIPDPIFRFSCSVFHPGRKNELVPAASGNHAPGGPGCSAPERLRNGGRHDQHDPKGRPFTDNDIGSALAMCHPLDELRQGGVVRLTVGPASWNSPR